MPTWPITLPTKALMDGFMEGQPQGAAIRTQMDQGAAKQRNRYTALNLPFNAVFEMTSAQVDTFWTFYRTTLGNGALKFDGLPHLRTGATVNHRFDVSSEPQVRAVGWDSYQVQCKLEIVP